MPIEYAPDTAWPPAQVAEAAPYYREWLAWYGGDPEQLHKIYAGYSRVPAPHFRPVQLNGGISGWVARKWWGNPVFGAAARRMHVPAASDISVISSDMLFSEPPALTLQNGDQGRFEELLDDSQLFSILAAGAEQASAAGGVYVRASINVSVAPVPVAETLLPDNAVPDFYGPFLRSVIFWRVISVEGATPVRRHLELHEMRRGVCVVSHALFEGGTQQLGRRIPLADGDEECKRLATLVDQNSEIVVGTSLLDVVYVPNVRPHRLIRGTMLGRSDYSGAEGSMDALDEAMTSWMRDIRLGAARLMVPLEYLRRPGGAGGGTVFDPEQEIYQAVNAAAPSDGPLSITPVQFNIRVQEHRDTVAAQWRTITSAAGLDTSDHDTENGPTQTATQVNDKGSRKRATRGKKIKYWAPALRQLLWVMQELAGMPANRVDVEFPDSAAPDIQTMAQTLQLISAAGAASTRTLVMMLHPDWKDEDVEAEVQRITSAVEDPGAFSGGAMPADPQPGDMPVDMTNADQPE